MRFVVFPAIAPLYSHTERIEMNFLKLGAGPTAAAPLTVPEMRVAYQWHFHVTTLGRNFELLKFTASVGYRKTR
jgi:hypothetical protein